MSAYAWLVVYSLLVLLFSVLGGYLPFLGRVTHGRLQLYLSVSAGVMLGAAFFHVMPDAMEKSGSAFTFGCWMALAVVGLFCIERFIAPHSHELDGGGLHEHAQDHLHHQPEQRYAASAVARVAASDTAVAVRPVQYATTADVGCDHAADHQHEHVHPSPEAAPGEHRAAAPAVAGWMAVLGLTIHTFMNGFGLAGAVEFDAGLSATAALLFPGLALFLAIVLHKPADALAISMVLSRKGVSRRKVAAVQFGFALMVPVGVLAFFLAKKRLPEFQDELTGAALAFSAGTFLFIALSDLLPEVQFHKHDRIPLFLALTLSVALMGGIALLEPHDHGEHEHSHSAPAAQEKGNGDHPED
jgi:zinc and cadmium transporter